MMMSEFIERTGFEPTAKEYAKIEEAYYDFDGDKDAFCKAFVKDGGARKLCKARAAEIDRLRPQSWTVSLNGSPAMVPARTWSRSVTRSLPNTARR